MAVASLQAEHHPDCYPSIRALPFFQKALELCHEGNLLAAPEDSKLTGVITPHIDFRVDLKSYSAAFRPLLTLPPAKTYVILGVGHRSHLEWNLDRRDYITPLGRAICDRESVHRLAEGMDSKRLFSPEAHEGEHSIEFALLWLQAIHQLHGLGLAKPVRFVPLLCGGLHSYVEGETQWDDLEQFHALAPVLGKILAGEDVRVIVSIDGCHLGPRFRHPFRVTPVLLEATAGWEAMLWSVAAQGDVRAFLEWMREEGNDRYFDGVGALALLMAAGGGKLRLQRTWYEQWFTERDASAVTFSSGRVLAPNPSS